MVGLLDLMGDLQRVLAAHLDVSRETLAGLKTYDALLLKWSKAKNLVAPSTIVDRHKRHFLDSAQLYPLIRKHHGPGPLSFLDLGAGAGFPSLVLSIMGLGHAHPVESVGKKASFMRQVARETGASVTVYNARIESLSPFPVDFITSRACATVGQLLEWSRSFLTPDTVFWLLKGESIDAELTDAQERWTLDIERFKSLSDPRGVILRLGNVFER